MASCTCHVGVQFTRLHYAFTSNPFPSWLLISTRNLAKERIRVLWFLMCINKYIHVSIVAGRVTEASRGRIRTLTLISWRDRSSLCPASASVASMRSTTRTGCRACRVPRVGAPVAASSSRGTPWLNCHISPAGGSSR